MPASFSEQGRGMGGLSSLGSISQNPAMLQLILGGMTQGSGLMPGMNTGKPAPMADWGPMPQRPQRNPYAMMGEAPRTWGQPGRGNMFSQQGGPYGMGEPGADWIQQLLSRMQEQRATQGDEMMAGRALPMGPGKGEPGQGAPMPRPGMNPWDGGMQQKPRMPWGWMPGGQGYPQAGMAGGAGTYEDPYRLGGPPLKRGMGTGYPERSVNRGF